VAHLKALPGAKERLKLFKANLLKPEEFTKPLAGCVGVLHTASPFFFGSNRSSSCAGGEKYNELNLLRPAIEGTKAVLQAALQQSVTKIVVTASTACVYVNYGANGPEYIYSETDWSDVDVLRAKKNWYALSKTLAEKEALQFMDKHPSISVCTINATLMFGPMLQPTLNTSSMSILAYLKGKKKEIANEAKAIVDVRDVALAHVLALENSTASGRYLCIGDCPSWSDVVDEMKRLAPTAAAAKLPTEVSKRLPSPALGAPAPHKTLYDCSRIESLGLVQFRDYAEQVAGTIGSLQAHGHM
jgi:nucleoside-diphosphate-sugar epimerase